MYVCMYVCVYVCIYVSPIYLPSIYLSTYLSIYLPTFEKSSSIQGLIKFTVSGIHWELWNVSSIDNGKFVQLTNIRDSLI